MDFSLEGLGGFEKYEDYALASAVATVPEPGVEDGKTAVWSSIALLIAGTVGDLQAVTMLPLRGDEPPVTPLLKSGAKTGEDEATLRGDLYRAAIWRLGEALDLCEEARVSSTIRKAGTKGKVASAIIDAAEWASTAAGVLNRNVGGRRPATWMLKTADYARKNEDVALASAYHDAALDRYRLAKALFSRMPESDSTIMGGGAETRVEMRALQVKMSLTGTDGTSLRRDADKIVDLDRMYDIARTEGPTDSNLAEILQIQGSVKSHLAKLGLH